MITKTNDVYFQLYDDTAGRKRKQLDHLLKFESSHNCLNTISTYAWIGPHVSQSARSKFIIRCSKFWVIQTMLLWFWSDLCCSKLCYKHGRNLSRRW